MSRRGSFHLDHDGQLGNGLRLVDLVRGVNSCLDETKTLKGETVAVDVIVVWGIEDQQA